MNWSSRMQPESGHNHCRAHLQKYRITEIIILQYLALITHLCFFFSFLFFFNIDISVFTLEKQGQVKTHQYRQRTDLQTQWGKKAAMHRESSIAIYIIHCHVQNKIASGTPLYSIGSSAQCSAMTHMGGIDGGGGRLKGEGIYEY